MTFFCRSVKNTQKAIIMMDTYGADNRTQRAIILMNNYGAGKNISEGDDYDEYL